MSMPSAVRPISTPSRTVRNEEAARAVIRGGAQFSTLDIIGTRRSEPMNPTSIYSKTGKGVQESSGKTSLLSRADRAVLTQIDGKTTFADLQIKFYKVDAAKLEALVLQLDKDGFVREVAQSGSQPAPAPIPPTPAAPRPAAAKPAPAKDP